MEEFVLRQNGLPWLAIQSVGRAASVKDTILARKAYFCALSPTARPPVIPST